MANQRLTTDEVLAICDWGATDESTTAIALRYGISEQACRNIWRGKSWSKVTGIPHRRPVVRDGSTIDRSVARVAGIPFSRELAASWSDGAETASRALDRATANRSIISGLGWLKDNDKQ